MRTEIEKCWYIYETHAERNFISDFVGGGFQQRWWELYFWRRLNDLGFQLEQPGPGKPDVAFHTRGRKIYVECVSPTVGINENKIPEIKKSEMAQKMPNDKIILRLTSAIYDKLRQARQRENQLEDTQYVIAVDISQLKVSGWDDDFMVRALYPIGNPIFHFDMDKSKKESDVMASYEYRTKIIKPNSGAVPTTSFYENSDYRLISAVLFCNANLGNIVRFGEPDFTIVHNHRTQCALSRKIFKSSKQYIFNGYNQVKLYKR
jgi:hypothetical protein